MRQLRTVVTCVFLSLLLLACDESPINSPYPKSEATANILYSSFAARPKTLDPVRSYSSDEYVFVMQIYEPPLQYHYLKRPYEVIPLTATSLPKIDYLDENNQPVSEDASGVKIAKTRYTISIAPGHYYQPHPAFAKDPDGNFLYHALDAKRLKQLKLYRLNDFKHMGTREVTADDYIYEIKRIAHPNSQSPIYGLMSEYIVGLTDYAKALNIILKNISKQGKPAAFLDLRRYPLAGVKKLDKYTYQITINGKYPQFVYWLTMAFFAPMPWEADYFYSQPGMRSHNLTLDWYPVGSGAFMLTENDPNSKMVMEKNPNYSGETYPTEGSPGDAQAGFLQDAGKPLPFVDKVVFSLEKEAIPRWNKFLQGYYDLSAVSTDSFDQAIQIDDRGNPLLTPMMKEKGILLRTAVMPSDFYLGFNMLDDVVGGTSERARKLRHAIAIAIYYEEFISIFVNGRGTPAQGPIPPGIFGHLRGKDGVNPYVYEWHEDHAQRLPIEKAKQLMAEAGYPEGRDIQTGEPLVLNYDIPVGGGPDDKAQFDWIRKQFKKIGIQLHVRATQYNRFQEKMRTGKAQLFFWGWNADYPDPENFLFLLYGPNGKVKYHGVNASNYANKNYDALFEQMKNMSNGPQRQDIINKMVEIARYDSPWVFGYHPIQFTLSQSWNRTGKINVMANNTTKYAKLDPELRAKMREAWNKPNFWPLIVIGLLILLLIVPVYLQYRRKQHRPVRKE